jgi:transcriptional regulator with XRE-family HTH domain
MDIEKRIGKTVREFRKARNMTISQLSAATNLSEAQLSRIETGKSSAPVSTLDVIAKALGTKAGFLINGEELQENPPIVLTKKNERNLSRRGLMEFGYNYEALVSKRTNKLMEPYLLRIDKDKSDETIIFNHRGEEFLFLLKGKLLFIYEDQKIYMEEGDSLYFDASRNHFARNIDKSDVEVIMVICSPE